MGPFYTNYLKVVEMTDFFISPLEDMYVESFLLHHTAEIAFRVC